MQFSISQIVIVLAATIGQFITGAIWYTPLFGKLWGKIHGFDKLDKKAQQKMMSEMGPIFGVQIAMTVVTSIVLVILHSTFPEYSLTVITFWIWLGFVIPAHVSGILFSNTPKKWMLTKSLIMAGGSFASMFAGAWIVSIMS